MIKEMGIDNLPYSIHRFAFAARTRNDESGRCFSAVPKSRRPAFSLLELTLVLALIVLLTAIAYPTLDGLQRDLRLSAAADQVRAHWALAQVRAMNEGRPYRFALVQGQGQYRVAPLDADYWSGSGPPATTEDEDKDKPLVLEDKLPRGVRFVTPEQAGTLGNDLPAESLDAPTTVELSQYTPLLTFLPDGTARDDGAVALALKGCRPVVIKLRAITGAVTVKPVTEEP